MKTHRKQDGVALFVTLLVVTIATLLATEIWFNNSLDLSRQMNNRSSYQAKHYAKGMFLWVRGILQEDFEQDPGFDNRNDVWNQPLTGIPLEDAMLSGKLTDLDSKFNLNNLVINGEINAHSYEYFKRVLINLELEQSLADKLVDWIDSDQIPMPQGAEDNSYLSKSPSYRTSGQSMFHISELTLIEGVDQYSYERLKAYVTVLPIIGKIPTKLNVNTASILLLKSINRQITTKDAINLYSNGFSSNKTLADFFRQPVINYYNLGDRQLDLQKHLSTQSNWFQALVNIQMQDSNFQKYALIYRRASQSVVKQWSDTAFE